MGEVSNANHVLAVKVGSITCTTADAKWYGIAPGETVKVHVICVETNAKIFFEDFFIYNDVVQEIVDCIMSDANASVVSSSSYPCSFEFLRFHLEGRCANSLSIRHARSCCTDFWRSSCLYSFPYTLAFHIADECMGPKRSQSGPWRIGVQF